MTSDVGAIFIICLTDEEMETEEEYRAVSSRAYILICAHLILEPAAMLSEGKIYSADEQKL